MKGFQVTVYEGATRYEWQHEDSPPVDADRITKTWFMHKRAALRYARKCRDHGHHAEVLG